MGRGVRPRPRDHRAAVADGIDGRLEELLPLVVGERRRLAGRPGDDDPVRAVLEQEGRERPERVEVDRAVLAERRHDRGETSPSTSRLYSSRIGKIAPSQSRAKGGVMLKEFKDFLLRGNIVELAIARDGRRFAAS